MNKKLQLQPLLVVRCSVVTGQSEWPFARTCPNPAVGRLPRVVYNYVADFTSINDLNVCGEHGAKCLELYNEYEKVISEYDEVMSKFCAEGDDNEK